MVLAGRLNLQTLIKGGGKVSAACILPDRNRIIKKSKNVGIARLSYREVNKGGYIVIDDCLTHEVKRVCRNLVAG